MSNNRIRYEKTKDPNILVSKRNLVTEDTKIPYKVFIDLNDYTYKIKNMNSDNLIYGGKNITNLNVLKRKIKEHLLKLGVKFEAEQRKRDFGLCPKGFTQEEYEKQNS